MSKLTTRQQHEARLRSAHLQPGAREVFPVLRERLLASRPIVGDKKPRHGADGIRTPLEPIYGKPTFRNVIERDDNGRRVHV
ncbi:hypothetical protein [Herbiconiux solani]|uniref:hypothetical protein n=1 Tax=Herbiconiux solani TaxID=661329 RepID=UPI000825CE38|nr:hypothetical protein [Herbiconiux solani]